MKAIKWVFPMMNHDEQQEITFRYGLNYFFQISLLDSLVQVVQS